MQAVPDLTEDRLHDCKVPALHTHLCNALLGLCMALSRTAAPAAQQPLSGVTGSQVQVTAGLEGRQVGALGRARGPTGDGSRGKHVVNLRMCYSKSALSLKKQIPAKSGPVAAQLLTAPLSRSRQATTGLSVGLPMMVAI
jgi:hypothetical protein